MFPNPKTISNNTSSNLLEYARQVRAKTFLFTSTGGVYGASYEKCIEDGPVNPINFYMGSKYAAELLVGNYRQFFNTIVLRPFFAYGAGQSEAMLIPRLVHSVASGKPIIIQGETDGIRINPLHVSAAENSIRQQAGMTGQSGSADFLPSPEKRHLLGQQGRAYVKPWHHPHKIAGAMLHLYDHPTRRFWDVYEPA